MRSVALEREHTFLQRHLNCRAIYVFLSMVLKGERGLATIFIFVEGTIASAQPAGDDQLNPFLPKLLFLWVT